jgi:release factor glutamine methyltransferase
MKIGDIIKKAQKEKLRTEMEVFLAHLLGWDKADLLIRSEEELPVECLAELQKGWTRILDGVPVAYLTRSKEFYGEDFYVDERVLVPRGETERIVDFVLERAEKGGAKAGDVAAGSVRILEVGTGSGVLAVSLKKAKPDFEVLAVDVSEKALEVASKNVVQHGVGVELFQSDLLGDLPDSIFGDRINFLIANLPYIGTKSHDAIDENVQRHEPDVALFGGEDGLRLYARLFDQVRELSSGVWKDVKCKSVCFDWIIGEIGFSQGADVRDLCAEKLPDYKCEILEDYQGLTRYFILEHK